MVLAYACLETFICVSFGVRLVVAGVAHVVSVGRPMVGYWAGVSLAELLCCQSQRPGHGPAGNATDALGYVRMRPLLHDDAPMPPQLCIKICGIFHFYCCQG